MYFQRKKDCICYAAGIISQEYSQGKKLAELSEEEKKKEEEKQHSTESKMAELD